MSSAHQTNTSTIPIVTTATAEVFDYDRAESHRDDTYVDAILREIGHANPLYLKEIERMANRLLLDEGFEAKTNFIRGSALSYALLKFQSGFTELEAILEIPENPALPNN